MRVPGRSFHEYGSLIRLPDADQNSPAAFSPEMLEMLDSGY